MNRTLPPRSKLTLKSPAGDVSDAFIAKKFVDPREPLLLSSIINHTTLLKRKILNLFSSGVAYIVNVCFSPLNIVSVLYALSFTISTPILPFMARRSVYGYEEIAVLDDGTSKVVKVVEGIPENLRGYAYGSIMAGYYLTKMIAAPWIGSKSDKIGRKISLIATFSGCSMTFLLTIAIGQNSMVGLFICRLLLGCFAANGALLMAYIRDAVPKSQQSMAFSQNSAAWGISSIAAATLLKLIKDDPTKCLSIASMCMALSAAIVWIFFHDFSLKRAESVKLLSLAKSINGGENDGQMPSERHWYHDIHGVYKSMFKEPLVFWIHVIQTIMPAQDLAPLINTKFGLGASFIASIASVRSVFRIALPWTPLIPFLIESMGYRKVGNNNESSATQLEKSQRKVAALMCIFMASVGAIVPFSSTPSTFLHMMTFKGITAMIKDSTSKAIVSSLAKQDSIGAFFGFQHCIKGFAGVSSNMITGLLISYSPEAPYYFTTFCELGLAVVYLFA